jgi:biopolymer transport protein ExbB/TolQ
VSVFTSGYRELLHTLQETKESGAATLDLSSELGTVERALRRAELEESHRLERGVTFLASVASAAPFIGLFGTVWGIMHSFQSIAASKNTTLAVVAPGIAEALLATAIGLFAAIPAVIFYNFLITAIRFHIIKMVKIK